MPMFTWEAGVSVVLWSLTLGVAGIPPVLVIGWLWGVILSHLSSYKKARDHSITIHQVDHPDQRPTPPSSSGI